MTIKEMIDCIVKGIPVEYKGIRCIPVGYGAKLDRRSNKMLREFVLIEENAKVDCTHIIGESGVKHNTVKCEVYKVADVEHRLSIDDIRMIDSVIYRHKEEKERERILQLREMQSKLGVSEGDYYGK